MTRAYHNQEQFNYGKLGILMRGRHDNKVYQAGCKTISNFRPAIQGPAEKRKGTVHVHESKVSATASRLVKFVFSEADSFVLEFGASYIRFFQGTDSVYEASQAISNITQANPAVVTYVGADTYTNGKEVLIEGVVGMTEVNGNRYKVANVNVGANTFELQDIDGNNIDSTGFTAYGSVGTAKQVYEITSPYSATEVDDIKYAQIGDIMYIAHPSYRPHKLTRVAANSWTIAEVDNKMGPVEDVNETATTVTLTGSAASGATSTWTASVAIFDSSHVGSVWAIADAAGANIGYARMTGFTSTTIATFTNQTALFGLGVASTNWYEASWSGVRGYPRAVAFHEQRIFYAGTTESPLTVYGSVTGGVYENFDIDDASADDALIFDLAGQINTIQWLVSDGDFLVGGTAGGLSFVTFDITDTTTTPRAKVGTAYGSSAVQGILLNDQVMYLNNSGQTLYETRYDDISLKYISVNMNDINKEILGTGATYLDSVENPDIAAIAVSDGDLKCLSRNPNQEISGWYEYQWTDGAVESVAVVPTGTGDDRIWMVINREINSVTRRYVEYIDVSSNDIYLDSSVAYSGSATRTFNGLEHLEGETVEVWGDGSYAGQYTVSSGSITIPLTKTAIEDAYIGLSYVADLEIMPINVPFQNTGFSTQTLQSHPHRS